MAAKKKAKKKTKTPVNKTRAPRRTPKKSAKKKSSPKKMVTKPAAKPAARISRAPKKRIRPKEQMLDLAYSESPTARTLSGSDSQGLSQAESADSESVSELLDEGNAFEAGVVEGVEQADDADEKGVRTREVPEDDVPEEYLDKD